MNFFIPLGDFAPVAVPLLVLAIAWAMILLETRRRRRRAAAGLPIYDGMRAPGEESEIVRQSLPLSREVVEHFRSTGPGWPARIDEVLKRHVRDEEDRARRPVTEAPQGATARLAQDREAFRGEEDDGA